MTQPSRWDGQPEQQTNFDRYAHERAHEEDIVRAMDSEKLSGGTIDLTLTYSPYFSLGPAAVSTEPGLLLGTDDAEMTASAQVYPQVTYEGVTGTYDTTLTLAAPESTSNTGGTDANIVIHGESDAGTNSAAIELNCDKFGVFSVAPATQASKINDPSGGATVDAEARTAINAVIDVLERFGLSST